eukprot:snap_masked-scaffold_22-processed-gene-0.44-mRNA-1 protein AED:1.00 eAED:1.00 QI:0/-1/0/0/-1/1/1/0/170
MVNEVARTFHDIIVSNPGVAALRQECESVDEYEDFFQCLGPFNDAVEDFLSQVSLEVENLIRDIVFNEELSLEDKSEQLIDLLGEPGLCVPELFETIHFPAFCGLVCEDGFCEANQDFVESLLIDEAARFGCEVEARNVCEDFQDITGSAKKINPNIFVILITLLGFGIN